jgi:hypothetical protein
MALLALIAAAEATLFSASQAKRYHARRQQVLMGNAVDSVRALPLCRWIPQTEGRRGKQTPGLRCFETGGGLSPSSSHTLVRIPALVRDPNGYPQTSSKAFHFTLGGNSMTLTPSTKGAFIAGVGLKNGARCAGTAVTGKWDWTQWLAAGPSVQFRQHPQRFRRVGNNPRGPDKAARSLVLEQSPIPTREWLWTGRRCGPGSRRCGERSSHRFSPRYRCANRHRQFGRNLFVRSTPR